MTNTMAKYTEGSSREPLDIHEIKYDSGQGLTKRWKQILGIVIGTVITIILIAVIAVAITKAVDNDTSSTNSVVMVPEEQRIDCFPEAQGGVEVANDVTCAERGCIWEPSEIDARAPPCFVPNVEFGFRNTSDREEIEFGYRWTLEPINSFAIYGENLPVIVFDVEFRKDNLLRFKFDTPLGERFKVDRLIPLNLGTSRARNPLYDVDVYQHEPFAFRVVRSSSGTVIWDTGVGGLVFTDQFLQIATRLPTDRIYGFGENLHYSLRHDMTYKTWPLWARDQPPFSAEQAEFQNMYNLYSVHPYYECVEEDGSTHGVLLYNANAMDYTLTPLPMLTYKTTGGILDFYVFMGPTPETVVQQYTTAVGKPYMPPYWMLGFQLSRYGYRNVSMIRESVERTHAYDIPLDVVYADIDHMDVYRIFTLDPVNYDGLNEYFSLVRDQGMKTVIILDPTVEVNSSYSIYTDGVAQDVYIKWENRESMPPGDYEEYNRTDMMGAAWPQWKVVFPDFFHSDMEALWTDWLVDFRQNQVPFDALWLDMNEPANFDTNGWRPWNWDEDIKENWTLKCPESKWDDPPYRTMAAYMYDNAEQQKLERLSGKTVCLAGVHGNNSQYRHYDVHSLYGYQQTKISLNSIREAVRAATVDNPDLRSMVVTRSTYAGSSSHAGRWLGDNASTWKDLRLSIIGMLEFNILGFPYIGADICGYFNDCPAELCRRWQELGAFYPYSRNHNNEAPRPQDPGIFGDYVAIPTRDVMRIRYTLLPYLYTLFHNSHVHGSTVVRPLFHEFPEDPNTFEVDTEFLWGAALLIIPILQEESESNVLQWYAPRGRWYNYYTGKLQYESSTGSDALFVNVTIDTPIQLLLRGGYLLPTQMYANNTQFSRKNAFGLKVMLDAENGAATGELFWDDGDTINTYENGNYYFAYYTAEEKTIRSLVQHYQNVPEIEDLIMNHVEVMGVTSSNDNGSLYVYVNGAAHTDFTYDAASQVLNITSLNLPMKEDFTIIYRDDPFANATDAERLDCCPEGCDETTCTAAPKNCLWGDSSTQGVPWCYLDSSKYGYSSTEDPNQSRFDLTWKNESSIVGGDIQEVLVLTSTHDNIYRIRATDMSNPRYEVPLPLYLPADPPGERFEMEHESDPFTLKVKRTDADHYLFDTSLGGFTMADQFIQFSTRVPSTNVYGLGEHVHPGLRHDFTRHATWPIFARDEPPKGGANLYSSHPFLLCVEPDGRAYGLLMWNSNSMEVTVYPAPAVSFRAIGGIMDIYIIIGENPEQVIERYTRMIGHAYLPPYWALGFQISRYGYNTLANMSAALDRTVNANIPLDVIYMDIDAFEEYKSFTYDRVRFAGLPDYVDSLHDMQIKFISIVDPFLISNDTNYLPYDLGLSRDVFVKWPPGTSPDFDEYGNDNLLGWAWPIGKVVFPDYFHVNATDYWEEIIIDFRNTIPFDGLWLDMNEPANFGTNEDKPWNWPEGVTPEWSLKCPEDTKWDAPPYKPASQYGPYMCDKTICMTAVQKEGEFTHYDTHNLYGHSQTVPTLSGVRRATQGKRSMVITRSTFPGTGVFAGRWLGDNAAIWPHLKDSVIGMIEFNWFGIPYVGADICGYFDSSPEDLCQRWHQLGAFYPFSRNHNGLAYNDQDPGMYSEAMQSSTRKIINIRYQLLPYLYTLFFRAHINGNTVVRPLFHHYSTDPNALRVEEQFMWGPALLISPVLRQYATEVLAYFPNDRWFDYYTGVEMADTGRWHRLSAPPDHIPLHLRGGHILPLQQPANTTYHSRQNDFGLLVVPDAIDEAVGELFWDDGERVDTIANSQYCLLTFTLSNNAVRSVQTGPDSAQLSGYILNNLRILGVDNEVTIVTSQPSSPNLEFTYDADAKVLYVEHLQLDLSNNLTVQWEYVS